MTLDRAYDVIQALLTATIAALFVAAVQRPKRLAHWFAMAPARRIAKRSGRTDLYRVVDRTLSSIDDEASGAAFWERLPACRDARLIELDRPIGEVIALLEPIVEPGSHGLIASLLYSGRIKDVQSQSRKAVESGRLFSRLEPVTSFDDTQQLAFGQWVTNTIGTPILADPLDARAKIGTDVRVWNSAEYVGQGLADTTYRWVHDEGCEAWLELHNPPEKEQPSENSATNDRSADPRHPKAGDYDGRVLVVNACATFADAATGDIVFALHTSESCYASTELGSVQPWGCKHLPVTQLDDPSSAYVPDLAFLNRSCVVSTGELQPLLTSFVSLMTSDRKLVLCRRSGLVKSGRNVVSATGGGVHEPGDSMGEPLDRNAAGWPDPTVTAQRELHEELGVALARDDLKPACVFLANSRNPRNDDGQLVVCVLYIARADVDFEGVQRLLWSRSDLAKGRFEVDNLIPLDLDSPRQFELGLAPLVEQLDQHGLLSCVYTAKLLWGENEARALLDRALDGKTLPTLVSAPGRLLPDRYAGVTNEPE